MQAAARHIAGAQKSRSQTTYDQKGTIEGKDFQNKKNEQLVGEEKGQSPF